ncbi:MAG: hypothetical protein H6733_02640 [Alphaproteobacteria bacterium]|nr:hypothetical protein [Alphaproteobacteria bacterium]
MRAVRAAGLAIVLAACGPRFDSVDAACPASVRGSELVAPAQAALLLRISCYRRYVGLAPLTVGERVQTAAQAHLDYLAANDALEPTSDGYLATRLGLQSEVTGRDGFTGDTPFTRNLAAGAVADEGSLSRGAVWGWFLDDADITGDELMADPFAREVFLQPFVQGVGLAAGTVSGRDVAYADLVSAFPSGVHVARPVVYPRDGDTDVPVALTSRFARGNELFKPGVPMGTPITVGISSDTSTGLWYDPYGYTVVEVALTVDGSDEPIPIVSQTPSFNLPMPLRTTGVFATVAPLAPSTTYRFEARVLSMGVELTAKSVFTTAADADTDVPDTDTDVGDTDTDVPDTDTDAPDTDTDTDGVDTDTDGLDTDTDPA